jgi:hypothetical protein
MLASLATVRALVLLTLGLALLGGCGADGSAGATAPGDPSGVRAHQAQGFVRSTGINTHTYYTNTAYHRRFPTIKRRLLELGVHHVRENLVPDRPDQYRMLNQLAAAGIDAQLIIGDPRNGLGGMRDLVRILATRLDGAVSAIEGPNEYDLSGDPNWRQRLDRYQRALYRTVHRTPGTAELPVVAPSVGQLKDGLEVTDLSRWLDYGNVHSYPDADPPELILSTWLAAAARTSGSKPVMATESGYHNALAARWGQRPASEAASATYLPRIYLDYYARGIVRTFPYELIDEFPDRGDDEPESNFGLLRYDLSPKPAFIAVRNLIDLLEDPGPRFTPGRLDFSLGGDTDNLRSLLLQKRDGRFYLALWRETSVWDPNRREPLPADVAPLQVSFANPPDRLSLVRPNTSTARQPLPPSAATTSLQIGPRVALLEIDPAG